MNEGSSYLEFSSNTILCSDNQFIDYIDVRDDEDSNVSEVRLSFDVAAEAEYLLRKQVVLPHMKPVPLRHALLV